MQGLTEHLKKALALTTNGLLKFKELLEQNSCLGVALAFKYTIL